MALGGPPLVKAVVGEDISAEELGGSKVHTEISGVADLEVADDRACIAAVKEYLSYFPGSNLEQPPGTSCDDPVDRMDEALVSLVPDSARRAYDMKKVIVLQPRRPAVRHRRTAPRPLCRPLGAQHLAARDRVVLLVRDLGVWCQRAPLLRR